MTKRGGKKDTTSSGDRPTTKKPKPASLPKYGLAEDVGVGRRSVSKEPRTGTVAAIDPGDPHRIFRFADTLVKDRAGESSPAVRRMGTWITFGVAGETFALPVEPVHEVLRVSSITRVPHAPTPIRGVTNLRGRVIPVVDLRLRLQLPEARDGLQTRVIVVGSKSRLIGLLVDSVGAVVHLDLDAIQPPPEDAMTAASDYISGVYQIESGLLLLLDVDRALIVKDSQGGSS